MLEIRFRSLFGQADFYALLRDNFIAVIVKQKQHC